MDFDKHFSDDGGRHIEWGRTAEDYAAHRPNYPADFYQRLQDRGIGVPRQPILDLGTGVGFLAQQFAHQGAAVTGIDIDPAQIEVARRRALEAALQIRYHVAPAENTGLPEASFEVATASQCWRYFNHEQASREVTRLLQPGGRLVTCHFCWLPSMDEVARRSEELVLKYNPQWTGGGFSGEVSRQWPKMEQFFDVDDFFVLDAKIPFTRASWRGRFRACRGVGASLAPQDVSTFDREHAELLACTVDDEFTVLHRIDCHILRPVSLHPSGREPECS
jgi:ubiquinone/menaquinone biosynthesis C-methylase UbiE